MKILLLTLIVLVSCSKDNKSSTCYVCTVNCGVGHPDYDTTICDPSYNRIDPINDGHGNSCSPKKCVLK